MYVMCGEAGESWGSMEIEERYLNVPDLNTDYDLVRIVNLTMSYKLERLDR